MKFLIVDKSTALRIAQARELQSVDFDSGERLASVLGGSADDCDLIPGIAAARRDGGVVLKAAAPDESHQLVFDLEAAEVFAGRSPAEALSIYHKTARFALKIWNQQAFGPAEHNVSGSETARYAILPLPLSSKSNFRLTIERLPEDSGGVGDHLLVYSAGKDEGEGPNVIPSRSRFHIALAAWRRVASSPQGTRATSPEPAAAIHVLELPQATALGKGVQLPYSSWIPLLTDRQRGYVEAPLHGASRLEGPAGTGKTLILTLRCIAKLREAAANGQERHLALVLHSAATRDAVLDRIAVIDSEEHFAESDRHTAERSLTVTTLQEWAAGLLGAGIAEAEVLDRDAAEAKNVQLLYVLEALQEARATLLESYRPLLSPEFLSVFRDEDEWSLAEMLRHEIAVVIKGRAEENLDRYKALPRLAYGLPVESEGDKGLAFQVYRLYQAKLQAIAQFDTDDVVLSALKQLDTPIWRRRRQVEGFDGVFVDETHLFNFNELSLIHFLVRKPEEPSISFAVDRAQAPGDRGASRGDLERQLLGMNPTSAVTSIKTVFRSSGAITALAQAVTAAGATLFTNFDDPLLHAASIETVGAEGPIPTYREVNGDEALIEATFEEATKLAERMPSGRAGVGVVVFDPHLLGRVKAAIRQRNRPFEFLERRGDAAVLRRARERQRFTLASADLVGGLEFEAVLLVGADKGRVPPGGTAVTSEAAHFARYTAHNHLYVALSRAKHEVRVLVSAERGLSEVLVPAREARLLLGDNG